MLRECRGGNLGEKVPQEKLRGLDQQHHNSFRTEKDKNGEKSKEHFCVPKDAAG